MRKLYGLRCNLRCVTLVMITLFTLGIFINNRVVAQNAFLPLSNPVEQLYEPYIHHLSSDMHTSVKPYLVKDLLKNSPYDSINTPKINETNFSKTLIGRKLFKEHLLSVEEEDYKLFLDPVFEFSAGHDQDYKRNYYTNSRGVWINGSIGKKFSFNSTFYENQSKFPYYLDSVIGLSRIVPGQARIKNFGTSFDYAFATGTLNYELNKHFTFQFGNDKNFFGDGYRSLLLSDNAFNYPYFKIVTDIWKIRYVNVFAVMQDLQKSYINDNEPFRKKYASMHYLDVKIGKRTNVGIFETVIWHSDSTGNRGFDLGYMNPFIFFRPVEFSIGSPDNVLLGINLKFKINSNNQLYGQILLDEFLMKEVKAGNGWWANKQGIQVGFKSFRCFGIQQLSMQGEVNYVRPFTYQHRESLGNYAHYRQALAHPLGANFIEAIGFINYSWNRFDLSSRLSYAEIGFDTAGLNMGQNIFKSYNDHYQEYDNKIGQGEKHKILWATLTINYLINPITRMSLFFEGSIRKDESEKQSLNTVLLQGGIRTRLFNRYYDF